MRQLAAWAFLLCGLGVQLPAAAQTFSVRGETLRYASTGEGPPVVMVSGWTQSLETWDFQVPRLKADFQVVRYDRGRWGAQTDPVDLIALLDQLALGRVLLVGHSIGSSTALRFAVRHPERVAALVLIGPPGAPGLGPWDDEDTWTAHLRRLGVEPPNPFVIAEQHGVDSLLTLAKTHPLFRLPEAPEKRQLLEEIWSRYNGSDLKPQDGEPVTPPVTETSVREFNVPTLMVIGESELNHFARAADRLLELLPDADLVRIPGGGHMINLAQPDRLAEVLRDFLLQHSSGGM